MACFKAFRGALLSLILLLALAPAIFAATLSGKITDNKGEILPFATVFVLGTTNGTTANASGIYQLQLSPGSYTIVCQNMGYEQQRKPLTVTGDATLNFSLPEQAMSMAEVVVRASDEDPAYRIIRKAIKKRKAHLRQVQTFQTDIYLKGVLRLRNAPTMLLGQKIDPADLGQDSGKGVVYLCEENATVYNKGDKKRTIIHSVRESGNAGGVGFSQLPPVITFYENNIFLSDGITPRGNVSPVADAALNFYKYRLEGEFREGNHTIFKLKVTPKRDYEPLFFGYLYIVDEDFAIHSLSLTATGKQMLETLDTLRLDQQYLPVGKDEWIIKSQLFYPTIKLMGFSVTGNFATVYSNQQLNQPVPDSVFQSLAISSYDKGATKKDSSYWNTARPIGLEADEAKDYQRKDSLMAIENDPVRNDSLRRRRNRIKPLDVILNGKTLAGKSNKQSFTFNSLVGITSFNTVEGLVFAPNVFYTRELDTFNQLDTRVALRYGLGSERFNAMGRIALTHKNRNWRGRGYTIGLEGGRYVFQLNPENPVNPLYNTVSTLLYSKNYLKLDERYDAALKAVLRPGSGVRVTGSLHYQDRRPLENTSDFSWVAESKETFTPNQPQELSAYPWQPHKAVLLRLSAQWRPGSNRYIQYPDYKVNVRGDWPLLSVAYEKGIPGILDSKTDFDKWQAGISDEVRLRLFGQLSYNISVGGFLNKKYVALPDLQHIYGNQFILSAPYLRAFQLAPYYQYSNAASTFAEAHAEYNLQGLITNKLPLLRQARWFFILGGNGLYVSDKQWYGEAFISIDNLGFKMFRFLRVDFVQSWNAGGHTNSGIRIGLRTGGLLNIRGSADSEW